ncbi:hypothetical protein ACK3Y9_18735, partial [Aeromonas caviae]
SKQESGIKRRSSHFSCVNTVPVNTYKKGPDESGPAAGDQNGYVYLRGCANIEMTLKSII